MARRYRAGDPVTGKRMLAALIAAAAFTLVLFAAQTLAQESGSGWQLLVHLPFEGSLSACLKVNGGAQAVQ